jgi:hypothetical protein
MQGISHPHSYPERQGGEASPSIVKLEACIAFDLDVVLLFHTEDNPLSLDVEDFGDS